MTQPQGTDLDWLFARQRFGVHPGLDRVRALLDRLGRPQDQFRAVLVGGTNGKGSTAATLAAILQADGRQVGLFTSPHLTQFSERFCVQGVPLSASLVAQALARVRPHAEEVGASFFEVVTALGCLLFAEAGVEIAVMEVGLGGRLDATNALDPLLSIVTSVGLDHTEILGPTREQIAREKAGILRPGKMALTGVDPEVRPILDAVGVDLWTLPELRLISLGWSGTLAEVPLPTGETLTLQTPLLGQHGARNAALAALAAFRLGVGPDAIRTGAPQTRWPGRMEVLPWAGGRVVLDGAHNPDGAGALAMALSGLGVDPGSIPVIFGAAQDKDLEGVAAFLRPLACEVILTRAVLSPRAAPPEHLQPLFAGVPTRLASTPAEALALLARTMQTAPQTPSPLALVCGSLYLIGEVRPLLLGQAAEGRERWQ